MNRTLGRRLLAAAAAVTAATAGWVEANPACECDRFDSDINPANDTAKIVLNPAAPAGGESNEGGGAGGGLPVTGSQTALFGFGGAALVAVGVLGFVGARRRRTRFEV